MYKPRHVVIKEAMERVNEAAKKFVNEKGFEGATKVLNLETGDFYSYQLPPRNALKAAYVAHVLTRVGRVDNQAFNVLLSASQEFEKLDARIEITENEGYLKLGSLYVARSPIANECIEDAIAIQREIFEQQRAPAFQESPRRPRPPRGDLVR